MGKTSDSLQSTKTEIIEKLGEYVEFITISNTEHPEIEKIDELLKGFQKCDF